MLLAPMLVQAASTIPVTVGHHRYRLELAVDPATREHGLMDRDAIGSDGMLFVFPAAAPINFWMKNTRIPLDMVFIGPQRKVTGIGHGEPLSLAEIPAPGPTKAVIELDAGRAERDGIAEGDTVAYALPPTVPVR